MLLGPSLRDLTNARAADVAIVDGNGDHVTSFGSPTPPSSATLTTVATSSTSAVLLASNANRRKFFIHNESGKKLFVAYAATATTTAYSFIVSPNTTYESDTMDYTGTVAGVHDSGTGNARITEITV